MNIQIEYTDFNYNETRNQILDRLSNGNSEDIVSLDQIWLGEFADNHMLRNLTADFEQWIRMDDLYEANLDGSVYNNIVYGLWQPMLGVCGIGRIYCKKQVLIQNH